MTSGLWHGVGAYVLWGVLAVYWKLLAHVPSLQIVAHRVLWSFVVLVLLLAVTRRSGALRAMMTSRVAAAYTLAAVLIAINWLVYIWAVISGFLLEASLGYFITPLVNVLLGVVALRERLRAFQWVAVGLAAAGVLQLTYVYGSTPWIALVLAVSFGLYGLVKNRAPLGSTDGMTLETGVLVPVAAIYLAATERAGAGAFVQAPALTQALLVGAGPVTLLPLLLFASAARRISLSALGILQYIAPTMQFLLGALAFHEPFTRIQLVGYTLVWVGLAVFTADGAVSRRTAPAVLDEAAL
ncbi:MAG: EamA family transporter RarD [Acidobacteria bacterium]|nr:EamA family transporter RarD [Acidobacteriota bacterium]